MGEWRWMIVPAAFTRMYGQGFNLLSELDWAKTREAERQLEKQSNGTGTGTEISGATDDGHVHQ